MSTGVTTAFTGVTMLTLSSMALEFVSVSGMAFFCCFSVSITEVWEGVGSGVEGVVTTGMVSRGWVAFERSVEETGVGEGVGMGVVGVVVVGVSRGRAVS